LEVFGNFPKNHFIPIASDIFSLRNIERGTFYSDDLGIQLYKPQILSVGVLCRIHNKYLCTVSNKDEEHKYFFRRNIPLMEACDRYGTYCFQQICYIGLGGAVLAQKEKKKWQLIGISTNACHDNSFQTYANLLNDEHREWISTFIELN
jgi:hypothetical protein